MNFWEFVAQRRRHHAIHVCAALLQTACSNRNALLSLTLDVNETICLTD